MFRSMVLKSPEAYIKKSLAFFRVNGSYALAKLSLGTTMITALLSYHLLVIYGHGNADAVCEGLSWYSGADWALACGRWATRYMNDCSGGVILPGVWIALYMLCVFMTVMLLAKLWHIESKLSVCLMSAIMAVNPTVIEQSLLQYMFMAWGLSCLFGTLFVYLVCRAQSGRLRYLAAPSCMAVAFGLYQAVLGQICVCFCITLILWLTDELELKAALRLLLRFAVASVLGVLLYFAVLKLEFIRYGVGESYRVEEFSLTAIFFSLGDSLLEAYRSFCAYFSDDTFRRKLWYALLALILLFCFGRSLVRTVRKGRTVEAVCAAVLLLLLPAFANASIIVFPYSTIVTIMEYQNVLVFPLLFALADRADWRFPSLRELSRACAYALTAVLCFGYIVSANATYKAYELSYRHLYFETSHILGKIYDMPDYTPEDVIVFAGYVDDKALRQGNRVFRYAYGMYDNLAFWEESVIGLQQNRANYLMEYFGVAAGNISGRAYNEAINSEQFQAMEVYPAAGSIRKIDGMIIVKLSSSPPAYG